MKTERQVQRSFSKMAVLQSLSVFAIVMLWGAWLEPSGGRVELGRRTAPIRFEPVQLDPDGFGPLRLAGAWRMTSADPRFGAISALALQGEVFTALSDLGVVIRFPKPGTGAAAAVVRELPSGPGDPAFKSRRDSEALLFDAGAQGWWVAFENRNQLWLYDSKFGQAVERRVFDLERWPKNSGIEAIARAADRLLLFPEGGTTIVELRGGAERTLRIENPAGRISDAVRLPSGELIVINRRVTLRGFSNSLARLDVTETGYRYTARVPLGVGSLDNVEAIAAERISGVGTRIWLMTDDNIRPPLRTLLLALDVQDAPNR